MGGKGSGRPSKGKVEISKLNMSRDEPKVVAKNANPTKEQQERIKQLKDQYFSLVDQFLAHESRYQYLHRSAVALHEELEQLIGTEEAEKWSIV
jgi:hypothetical protein